MKSLVISLLVLVPGLAPAQQAPQPLRVVAEETRTSWLRQDASGLVARSPQLVIQLPGADPSAPVQRQQASKLLRDFFGRAEEVEMVVHDAREMEDGRGLVELRRRYRVRGTQDVREQLLLLSYRRSGKTWTLVELRVGR
jgi:hypothetical protein